MARWPWYFYDVRFMSDRFHECNHTVCSWRYKSSEYKGENVKWNTSAAEQVNSRLAMRDRSTRFMNVPNAANALKLNIMQQNVDSYEKAKEAANTVSS
jgi:hypothetical protein